MIYLKRSPPFRYALASPYYDKYLHAVCKGTPGMVWDAGEKAWVGYPDAVETCVMRLKAYRQEVAIVHPLLEDPQLSCENAAGSKQSAFAGLYDYQKQALRFLLTTVDAGAILGLDLGLGKSVLALRLAQTLGEKTVVVGPAFLSGVWRSETKKWLGREELITVLSGTKPYDFENTDIVFCNYSVVHAWADTLVRRGYRFLVLEEAHVIQGEKARRTLAVRKLRESAVACVALTGTPQPNYVRNLWLLNDVVSPGRFGRFFNFALRYCDAHRVQVEGLEEAVWNYDGSSNEVELRNRLRWNMFHRTKAEVAAELPALTRQIIELDVKMSPQAFRGLLGRDGKTVDKVALRAKLDAAADRKLPQVAELVASHVNSGRRVIVYTYRRAVAEHITTLLKAAGISDCAFLHGGMPAEKRQRELARLKSFVKCLAVTVDALGLGVDLTFADVGVFAELPYEPWKLEQAEGRQHRRTSVQPVLVQYTIARGSIDELVRDVVISKLGVQRLTVGDSGSGLKDALETRQSDDEILDSLAARILGGSTST